MVFIFSSDNQDGRRLLVSLVVEDVAGDVIAVPLDFVVVLLVGEAIERFFTFPSNWLF